MDASVSVKAAETAEMDDVPEHVDHIRPLLLPPVRREVAHYE